MAKKTVYIFILFAFCLVNTTCRKKLSEPVNLYGMWVSNEGYCGYMYMELKKSGQSEYGTDAYYVGCSYKHWKGKSRTSFNKIFIGETQFDIVEKAELINTTDTMGWWTKRGRITAKMRLRNGFLHGKNTYTFYKIKDY